MFFEYLFPPEEKRIPFTAKEMPSVVYPMVFQLSLAFLVRRPNTRLLRCAIMAPTLIWTIRAGTVYQWWPPEYYKAYSYLVGASRSPVTLGQLMTCRDRSRLYWVR